MLFSKPTLLLLCLFEALRDCGGGGREGLTGCCPELLLRCWCSCISGRSCILSCPGSTLPPWQASLTVPFFPKPHKGLGEDESGGWAGTEHLTQQPQPSVLLPAKGTY